MRLFHYLGINWEFYKRGKQGLFPPSNWDKFIDDLQRCFAFLSGDDSYAAQYVSNFFVKFRVAFDAPVGDAPPVAHYWADIYYGEINGIPPDGFTLGNDPMYSLELTGLEATEEAPGKIWLGVTCTDDDTVSSGLPLTARWADCGAAADYPDDTNTDFYQDIATFIIDTVAQKITGQATSSGSYNFKRCRDYAMPTGDDANPAYSKEFTVK